MVWPSIWSDSPTKLGVWRSTAGQGRAGRQEGAGQGWAGLCSWATVAALRAGVWSTQRAGVWSPHPPTPHSPSVPRAMAVWPPTHTPHAPTPPRTHPQCRGP
jgi:hypothetical protein